MWVALLQYNVQNYLTVGNHCRFTAIKYNVQNCLTTGIRCRGRLTAIHCSKIALYLLGRFTIIKTIIKIQCSKLPNRWHTDAQLEQSINAFKNILKKLL